MLLQLGGNVATHQNMTKRSDWRVTAGYTWGGSSIVASGMSNAHEWD